jgi:hypothetical protein
MNGSPGLKPLVRPLGEKRARRVYRLLFPRGWGAERAERIKHRRPLFSVLPALLAGGRLGRMSALTFTASPEVAPMFRTILSSAALVVVPAVVVFAAGAQDKSKKTSHERLQPYWNQLELDERQREQYDRVAREFNPKIDKLEEELEALKERRRKAWLDILSSDQKKKLESLQASRGKKKPTDKEDKDGKETGVDR